MSGIETITPWATPDHRTYEQRILAALEELIRGQRELINLMRAVAQNTEPPTHLKPKARK